MTLQPLAKRSLFTGTVILGLAVLIGAFGAHGLKSMVTELQLTTFETGVRYQFYHGFGILMVAVFQQLFPEAKLTSAFAFFLAGVVLFSFNCYLYVLTGTKAFALIVPIGGTLFVLGWVMFAWNALKLR
jgi:uncharacterized membrane protein YgdD (TMEM256/DUF423 family)